MVVFALLLNELFLLASHLLPVDPVYLFRHRIPRNQKLKRYELNVRLFCAKVFSPRIYFADCESVARRLRRDGVCRKRVRNGN